MHFAMQFDYDRSLEPWKPAQSDEDAQIRMLDLHPLPWYWRWLPAPFSFLVPLRGTLRWVPLEQSLTTSQTKSESEPYKALSYTWGLGAASDYVLVNRRKLPVTSSLKLALLHLRPKSRPLSIWVDQISINQKNEEEKAEQVKYMDRIYSNCEETLAWLGPAADGSDELFDVLNKMGSFVERFNMLGYYKKSEYSKLQDIELRTNPEDVKTTEYHKFCDSMVPDFGYSFFGSIAAFYARPWFQRTWVIQEFSLPPKVTLICGYRSIQAETLMCVLQMTSTMVAKLTRKWSQDKELMKCLQIYNDFNTLHPFFAARQRRKARNRQESEGDSLYELLQKIHVGHNFQATVGCDMIYGLCGLVNDKKKLGIVETYPTKDDDPRLHTAKVYTEVARKIIEKTGNIDLLTFSQHLKVDMTLPSWVPDWRSHLRQSFASTDRDKPVDCPAAAIASHLEAKGLLPSWVPDWRVEIRRSFAWLNEPTKPPLFSACRGESLQICTTPGYDDKVLALKGYIVDEIEEIGGPWTGSHRQDAQFPVEELYNYLAQVRQMCLLSKSKGNDIYRDSARRDEALWRIPVADLDQDGEYTPIRAKRTCKLKYDHCLAQLQLQMQSPSLASFCEYKSRAAEVDMMGEERASDTDARGNIGSLYRIRMLELAGKSPFLSKIGYVGMGPTYMRPGDIVTVLCGATIPFVIRPVAGGKYRLIGECYCDGIMDGEIVELRGKQGMEDIVLV
ncbi:heterokaryon incompatibility protein-domain-containing protein [Paraphoma chrysanthemicola]|nr:heterokaryon incompatibility protein-domain-containing protein [Paraphoma chrysanthemicola]